MGIFSDPQKNIDQAGILPGMKIADFGAGSGAYTYAAARALFGSGCVYAIDIHANLLVPIKRRALEEGLSIEVIQGDIEKPLGTHLKESSVDLVLLCNTLSQMLDKKTAFEEIKRILVPAGKILLVDWNDSFGGIGPHPDHVITETDALSLCERFGFSKEKSIAASLHHYGMICKKL